MTSDLSTGVPPLRGTDPGMPVEPRSRTRKPHWAGWAPTRRAVLRAGGVAGLTLLGGVFPSVRRAVADGYDIYPRCPSYASDHDCSPGCGPSTVFADACVTSGENTGFHKDDQVTWRLRPNACLSGSYDGWMWRYDQACGACSCHIERRCHDGYRRTGSGWVNSICRWTTECGCPSTVNWPTVAAGDRGATVTAIQYLVTHHGFPTEPDGVYGPATAQAVRDFQTGSGLPVSGEVSADTWPSLAATARRGDSGEHVHAVQAQLNAYGYRLVVDGVFGAATVAATTDFQRQNRLTADGIVGPVTWRTMTGGAV
ncbi:peptidoglycan-binding domain-containing protein [Actinophytocola gossypii]|uniref:Peptidoglycan-binding protein n=1 Tax=Actinophytocola gossypii TaxID=2812003 RepID=A0ABT2J2Y3_9PSEU|nr:peptidoglycan-binding protein [Actinophytocola gossypii]MCT2582218.1 peptidoglycan-binding protein [Actinophytocola gossypii]